MSSGKAPAAPQDLAEPTTQPITGRELRRKLQQKRFQLPYLSADDELILF